MRSTSLSHMLKLRSPESQVSALARGEIYIQSKALMWTMLPLP